VIVSNILKGGEQRERMTEGIYIPTKPTEQLARLENAMKLVLQSAVVEKKISKARRDKTLPKLKGEALLLAAKEKNVITSEEFNLIKKAQEARLDAIQVDDFSQEQFLGNKA